MSQKMEKDRSRRERARTAERRAKPRSAEKPLTSEYQETREAGFLERLTQDLRHAHHHRRRRWHHILRERRAHRFPESDRLPIQIILLLWGMLPMWFSLAEEKILDRRHGLGRIAAQLWGGHEEKHRHPAKFFLVAGVVAAVVLFAATFTRGVTVTYDGEQLACLSSRREAESVRAALEKDISHVMGQQFHIEEGLLEYKEGWLRREALTDKAVYEEELSDRVGLVVQAYCLFVDGDFLGATPYEGAMEALLEQLKKASVTENTISCEFGENVEVRELYVLEEKIKNLGEIADLLYSTKTEEVTYEVKKGDTWSQIAERNGMTSKELEALNPGYNPNKLQIGEVLTMSASVPYLTMTVTEQDRYVDTVPYSIEYIDSANLFQGDYEVKEAGEYGKADVVAKVTFVNGVETERTILSSVTLKEPKTETQLRGTKVRPTWYPTGSFRWPCSGHITSTFGGRKSPGGIGSTNHKGIDIAAPKGTPVYAADGGTVTYAGWMSGYGYLVQITHGNGYVTYYGHNSSLTVSVGQHVYKGQQIARVGSTGNSTGNHCHFEVRVNGVAKNPMNYLR